MTGPGSLAITVPCGLPWAVGCRCLRRLGYRRAAWAAGVGLGVMTVSATVFAGLPGPAVVAT